MAKVLVLEDQEECYFPIKQALEPEYELTWAQSMSEAMKKFNGDIDVALVDIGLPDGDGYQFCNWIRTTMPDKNVPIVFVSGKSSDESRIAGFSVGGDDYICKPFNILELKARIKAKLKWVMPGLNSQLEYQGISADLRSQRAYVKDSNNNTVAMDLTPIEFKILCLFLVEPSKVFSRDEILDRVWGRDIYVFPRSVDTHVSKLRRKLGKYSPAIRSVHGVGYKLIAS